MQTKDLLDCSQDVLRAEKALEVQYEEYYEQLADQQSLSPEEQAALRSDVTREVEMLEDASSCLRQAHQWASDKADELTTRLREGQESSQRKGLFRRAPANSVIDLEEEQADSFASGVNFYKVALICIAGSFAGVVVEILWCLFRNGYIESRSGLVYGPFNPVYGIGAVVMTLALYRYRNRSSSISFFGGAVVGSVIEYLLSWGQETLHFLGLQSDALQSRRPDLPALLFVLGHSGRPVDQKPLSPGRSGDFEDPQPVRQGPHLGPHHFHGLRLRHEPAGSGPLVRAGPRRDPRLRRGCVF